MWVSDRDLCRAFEHAIDDERISFAVYNMVSRNPGMRWEIDSWRATRPAGWGNDARAPAHTAKVGLGAGRRPA